MALVQALGPLSIREESTNWISSIFIFIVGLIAALKAISRMFVNAKEAGVPNDGIGTQLVAISNFASSTQLVGTTQYLRDIGSGQRRVSPDHVGLAFTAS